MNLNEYKEKCVEGHNNIVEWIVRNNLSSPIKISNVIVKEITLTGDTTKKDIVVVEKMFEGEVPPVEDTKIQKDEEKIQDLLDTLPTPPKSKKVPDTNEIKEEIPVGIEDLRPSQKEKMNKTAELINGLKNNRDKKKPGILKRIKKFVS